MSEDLTRLDPPAGQGRREFVAAAVAGFALAAQPVSAETIITDAKGLDAGLVKVPVGDDKTIPAYYARPAGDGPFPTVLVVQEIFGLHVHIKDICRRLAKKGYLAVAPELYSREGDTTKMTDFTEIRKIVSKVPDAQVLSDLDAAAAWAIKTGKGDKSKLAVTGFCWGGRIVWLYAALNKDVKAGVAWYGRLVEKADKLHPKHPIDVVADLKAPVLGLYGEEDMGIPVKTVEQMRAALKKAKKDKDSEIILYPGTPHAFYADYRKSYREKEAKDAWAKMLAFFEKHGVK